MAMIRVIDRQGIEHEVECSEGRSLMESLRDLNFGVAAICGGECSCATCHVYVDSGWLRTLPERSSEEHALLSALAAVTDTSRLSCQIAVGASLGGLRVTIAPEE